MGFVLTVIYVALTIISPAQFGSDLYDYHILTFIAIASAVASLPGALSNSRGLFSKQTLLLFGFIVAIVLSRIINAGGAWRSLTIFLPSTVVFFLIVLSVTSARRLKILVLAMVASCLVVSIEGICGYYLGFGGQMFVVERDISQGIQIGQIRGAGFLSDPNDFSQMLLIAAPLVFFAWRRRHAISNTVAVYLPLCLMLWAIFLTHSRGALMGLAVLVLMATRKKIPTWASLALVTTLVVGMLALNFTGGRGISLEDGADRLEAWSNGLEMFRRAPIFGVGFGAFSTDFNDITAHNSLVLCLAELGLIGSTLWVALLVSTTVGLNKLIGFQPSAHDGSGRATAPRQPSDEAETALSVPTPWTETVRDGGGHVEAAQQTLDEADTFSPVPMYWTETIGHHSDTVLAVHSDEAETALPVPAHWPETVHDGSDCTPAQEQPEDEEEVVLSVPTYCTETMRLALIGFMTTSWFLSRCYSPTMWLMLGLATTTIVLQPPPAENQDHGRLALLTVAAESMAIALIYSLVRLHWGGVG